VADWVAERNVGIAQAVAAVRRRHRGLAGEAVRLGQGWDNVVIGLGEVLIRVSVREVADPLMRKEWALLPELADLPLAVPELLDHGEALPGLPGPWALLRAVPGDELSATLARGGQLADPETIGRFLRRLHRPGRVERLRSRLPLDPIDRADPGALERRVDDWLGRAKQAGLAVPNAEVRDLLRATDLGPPAAPVAVVHSDLHLRHLLVDAADRCAGVIDWGDACLAPPVADLGLLWWAVEPEGRAALVDAYGAVDPATLAASRRFAAFSCLALWVASTDLGQRGVAEGARVGLHRVLRGGIGGA